MHTVESPTATAVPAGPEEIVRAMAASSIFGDIPHSRLPGAAAHGLRRTFAPGAILMNQGEVGDCMHIIVSGRVKVERNHADLAAPLLLAELGSGQVVGEMAAIESDVRSATVTAIEETHTLEISAEALPGLLLEYPQAALAMLYMLSRRLRNTNTLAAEGRT